MLQPKIVIPERVDFPAMSSMRSKRGVPIHTLFVEGDVARVSFVFRAGTSCQGIHFSASTTANLLGEGSEGFSSKVIAERLDFYGSYYGVTIDRDWSVVTFAMLSKFFDATMAIASDIILRPSFEPHEVSNYCTKRKALLLHDRSKPSTLARELFSEAMFGCGHPYGVNSHADHYDSLSREDIVDLYRRLYVVENCFVVASGNIGQEELAVVESLVDGLLCGGDVAGFVMPQPQRRRFAYSHRSDSVQSCLRLGLPLFPRTHPDYVGMQIVSTALGGYFSSRLVHNLREERGLTYGVFAGMVNFQEAGYMSISSDVAVEGTDEALEQIFLEVDRLSREGIQESELRVVRNIIVGEIMRIVDGPFGVADVAIENLQNGQSNDYFSDLVCRIRDFSVDDFGALASRYMSSERLIVSVVGGVEPTIMRGSDGGIYDEGVITDLCMP